MKNAYTPYFREATKAIIDSRRKIQLENSLKKFETEKQDSPAVFLIGSLIGFFGVLSIFATAIFIFV